MRLALQADRNIHAPIPAERLFLALGAIAAAVIGAVALFTPYPFIAPFLTILFAFGLVAVRFPELAVYGILVGVFFTGGDNPLSPLRIHGLIKVGAPLLMLWAIARTIGSPQRKLAPYQKMALWFGVAFSLYSAIGWLIMQDDIPRASALILQRMGVSISLFVSIILLQDRLKLNWLMLAFAAGAFLSSLLVIPLDTAHIENGREAGFMGDPNLYSAYLVTSVPLAASFYFRSRNFVVQILALFAVGLITITVLKTGSRAGLICCAFGIFASFAVSIRSQIVRWRQTIVVASIAAAGAIVVVLPQVSSIFEREDSIEISTAIGTLDRSTARRISYIDVGLKQFTQDPLLGSGTGSFPKAFAESNYSKMFMTSQEIHPLYRRAHNSYLEILAELGLIGFFLFASVHTLAGLSVLTAVRNPVSRDDPIVPHRASFLGISLASIWLMMITLSIQEMYVVWIFCALCLLANEQDSVDAK